MIANRVLRASTDAKSTPIGAGMNIECLTAEVGNAMCAMVLCDGKRFVAGAIHEMRLESFSFRSQRLRVTT
ncbi:MAG: hypothetical protein KA254_06280 [Rhodoferax sp.]|jgi:hypothetical protein|nr:hypothetical protein [Rhodoferax sp.]